MTTDDGTSKQADDQLPWVLYVRPGRRGDGRSVYNYPSGLADAFGEKVNLIVAFVPPSSLDRIRAFFMTKKQTRQHTAATSNGPTTSGGLLRRVSAFSYRFEGTKIRSVIDGIGIEPDLVFVDDLGAKLSDIGSLNCSTALWVNDPHVGFERYFDLQMADEYSHVFVAQRDYIKPFADRGCKRVSWLPPACDARYVSGPRTELHNIAFVGTQFPNHPRETILRHLREKFQGVYLGNDWLFDLGLVYRSSRIVINKSLDRDLNFRVFEAMGAGSLLVTDRIGEQLSTLFKEDFHLVCYDEIPELTEKVGFYLAHDDLRKQIAERGRAEVLAKHTFGNRVDYILQTTLH